LSFLLDTNAISEIRRGRDQRVRAWVAEVEDADLHLSVLTLGEIRKGIELLRSRDAAQAEAFDSWLSALRTRFADRIMPIDDRVAEEWGRLNAAGSRRTVDSLIAATARIHDLIVVTRHTRDFEGCGVPLLNPWDHEPGGHGAGREDAPR
jgi:predicted nucleic acid-binding protein